MEWVVKHIKKIGSNSYHEGKNGRVPSGHVLKSTLAASFLAWPADVVLTTSNSNPASCKAYHQILINWSCTKTEDTGTAYLTQHCISGTNNINQINIYFIPSLCVIYIFTFLYLYRVERKRRSLFMTSTCWSPPLKSNWDFLSVRAFRLPRHAGHIWIAI